MLFLRCSLLHSHAVHRAPRERGAGQGTERCLSLSRDWSFSWIMAGEEGGTRSYGRTVGCSQKKTATLGRCCLAETFPALLVLRYRFVSSSFGAELDLRTHCSWPSVASSFSSTSLCPGSCLDTLHSPALCVTLLALPSQSHHLYLADIYSITISVAGSLRSDV